jgi:hypothetical protein
MDDPIKVLIRSEDGAGGLALIASACADAGQAPDSAP